MGTPLPPVLRLLEQERDLLGELVTLAARQETAMIEGNVGDIEDVIEQESGLLQREARISARLHELGRATGSVTALLAGLPDSQRSYGQELREELVALAGRLAETSARLKALADAGLNRINFVYQVLARSADNPGVYRAPGRRAGRAATTVFSQRI